MKTQTKQTKKSKTQNIKPPKAEKIAKVFEEFGRTRTDNYYWLKERDNPKVIDLIEKENTYADFVMKPFKKLQDKIYDELVSRIAQDDTSVPYYMNKYWYYARVEAGRDYAIYCRRKGDGDDFGGLTANNPEEILLDMNEIAKGLDCCILGQPRVSPDNTKLIYGLDTKGNRLYDLYLKDLNTGEVRDLKIGDISGSGTWMSDSKRIVYCVKHPQTLRDYRVYLKNLEDDSEPALIFEELNESYSLDIYKTTSKKFIVIRSNQHNVSDEAWFLSSEGDGVSLKSFSLRRDKVEYAIDHIEGAWFIRTNDNASNFKIMRCSDRLASFDYNNWEVVVNHRTDLFIEDFMVNNNFLAIQKKENCIDKIDLFRLNSDKRLVESDAHCKALSEFRGVVGIGVNSDPDAEYFRFNFTSMVEPHSTYDYYLPEVKFIKRKQTPVPNYDSSKYKTWTEYATAQDGTKIPISLVVLKEKVFSNDTPKLPTLLYGYGAYGFSNDPDFASNIFSLVDRGMIYAIAHIRGGQEGGRQWYEQGRMHNKINSFTDLISCAEHLIEQGISDYENLGIRGGSAGGLLVGASVNMRPDLFKFVIAQVPFVDVMTTMLDDSLPLTVGEYTEWGNPNLESDYWYMRRYSPYDNIQKVSYPTMFVTAGINDSQVQYFEPLKWVQKLREFKTDKNKILFRCEMGAGHGGKSGRFKSLEQIAEIYAFVIATIENKI